MNPQYPIRFAPWKVLRRFSVGGWCVVKDADEVTARKAYSGHRANLGRGAVCLVRPCGKVEEVAKGGTTGD